MQNDKLRLIKQMPHMLPAVIAIEHGIRGHVSAPSAASAGSAQAIGEAYRLIKDGYMDWVLVGGLDFNCDQNAIPGMDAFGAVSKTFNDNPEHACRPFDKKRAGTILADGGAMILLESLEKAEERSCTNIYAEVAGFAQTSDAFHALRPTDTGVGLIKAIQTVMTQSGLQPKDIDMFNCHATSTPKGDQSEAKCIKSILGCTDITKMSA